MKTTLTIDDRVVVQLEREAAARGQTLSEFVEGALRLLLEACETREELPPLPAFRSHGSMVDVSDRDALYHAMEGQ